MKSFTRSSTTKNQLKANNKLIISSKRCGISGLRIEPFVPLMWMSIKFDYVITPGDGQQPKSIMKCLN